MSQKSVETAVFLWGDRHAPPAVTVAAAEAAVASVAVDGFAMSDQLMNFIPPSLWNTQNTPLAEVLTDPDSMDDAFALASFVYAHTPGAEMTLLIDSIRHGPAQLIHAMLTLAKITEGRVTLQIGAGEIKQCNPFGWKRSQGLSRLEDLYKIFEKFMDSDGPISHEGNHWTLKNAFLGGAKPYRPRLMGLGGGPKILDLSSTYANGFASAAPCVWAEPDEAADFIAKLKAEVADKGRDPDLFKIGMACPVLVHEDPAELDRALDNQIVRWISAIFGRTQPEDWRKVGVHPAVPEGWTYYMKMKPFETSREFAAEVVDRTSRKMAELSFIWGTAEEVAARLNEYVAAGVEWISPVDYMPIVSDPEEGALSLGRTIEICEQLKVLAGSAPQEVNSGATPAKGISR